MKNLLAGKSALLTALLVAVSLALTTAGLFGVSNGSTTTVGRTQKGGSTAGCGGCHGLNTAITVQISGPASLHRGQTAPYTLTTSKSGASGCVPAETECRNVGIDVASDDNTLTVEPGEPAQIINAEITHSCGDPCTKALLRSITATGPAVYKFNYTMPAGVGVGTSHFLYAVVAVGPMTSGGYNHAPNFQVLTSPPPLVSGLAPTSGPLGTRVILTGTALSDVTVVRFNGISAAFRVDSGTRITAFVPSGATTGTITATAGGETAASPSSFTVTSGAGARKFGRLGFVLNSAEDQVSPAGDTVSFYVFDNATGLLRHNGYEPTGSSSSTALAVDPFERFVFVANRGDDSISVLKIEPPGASPFAGRAFGIGSPFAVRPLPRSLAVDPGGRFLYVAGGSDVGEVTSLSIDSSGALTQVGVPVAAGDTPQGITVHPSGRFVYVANYLSNNVSAYSVDPATGSLTTAGTFASPGSFNPFAVTVHPNGSFLYVANESNHLSVFSINQTTGALAFVSNSASLPGSTPHSVVVDPSGKFAFVANSNEFGGANQNTVSSYSIDAASGSLTLVGTVAAGSIPESVVVDPGGLYLYAANRGSHDVSMFSINQSTGALTRIRRIAARNGASSIALSSTPAPVGYAPRFAYVTNRQGNDVSAYTINGLDGVLTPVAGSPFAAGTSPSSVAVDPTGRFAFAANEGSQTVSVYMIDTATGALTSGGETLSGGVNPVWVAVDPKGTFVYVANNGNNVGDDTLSGFTIDQTGALVAMAGSPFLVGGKPRPSSIAVDPSGRFAYVANAGDDIISAWAIHPTTGALTHLDHDPATPAILDDLAGGGGSALTVDPSGSFVVVADSSADNTITPFAIDPSTGLLTKGTAVVTGSNSPRSVMFEPAGRFAYVVNFNGETAQAYSMSPSTGALALFQSFQINPDEMFPTSVSVEPSGRFAFVSAQGTGDVRSYSINSTTGALGKLTEVSAGTGPSFIASTGVLTEPPAVSSVSPASGPEGGGTSVTITGSGFNAGATVTFGGTAATNVVVGSATSITAPAPAHTPGAVDVVVRNTDGQSATATGAFTYLAAPGVTSISPGNGTSSGGTNVTITGTGFMTGATVTFGGTAATNVVVASATSITATAPAHAPGAVDIVVRNADGQSATSTGAFTYLAAPRITSISPSSGTPSGGTNVTITGSGFMTGATVTFGGTAATNVTVVSPTSITATTPAHAAGVVDVVVGNADGQSGMLAAGFNYTTAPKGDVNGDGQVTVGDVFYLINNLFASGPPPIGSGDVNGDGQVTAGDVFYLINFLFAGGPPPL